MKDNKKKIEEQEQLLDHLIEYGGKQYIDDEIEKFDELPEMDLPKDFNDRMDKMFKDAYRKEVRKERFHLGKKIAAAAVIIIGIASVTAMNVKAFREPILNFIFRQNSTLKNKTKVDVNEEDNNVEDQFQFNYIPDGYECTKIQTSDNNSQIIYDFENTHNKYLYIISSGIIFASMHLASENLSLNTLLYIIPYSSLGITFAYTYYKTNNIFSTIMLHSFHNTMAIILYLIGG